MSHLRHVFVSAALLVLAACDTTDTGPNISGIPGYEISTVRVFPGSVTVFIPDTIRPADLVQLQGVVTSRGGTIIGNVRLAWSSTDPLVAVVDSSGLVTPMAPGVATIWASAAKAGSATIVVRPATSAVSVSPVIDTIFVDDPVDAAGDTVRLVATAVDQTGAPLTGVRFEWASSAGATATVDSAGLVQAHGLGEAEIRVSAAGAEASALLRVVPLVSSVQVSAPFSTVLDGDTLQLQAQALDYSGAPLSRAFAWSSSVPAVAQVDSTGSAIFSSTGQATFTATTAFRGGSVTVTALPRALLAVEAGNDFTCGVTPLGRGYCWGVDDFGQLASAADSTCFESGPGVPCTLPPKRMNRSELSFLQVSAGGDFACGVASDQMLYCWGNDEVGQIGNGGKGAGETPALATVKTHHFTTVSAGAQHACALTTGGTAYCWGLDDHGQLGDARKINSSTPIPVADTALVFQSVSAGDAHTCGLLVDGHAYCWGDGSQGQLGTGTTNSSDIPAAVSGGLTFVAIAAGASHTCAVATSGAVFCWGDNSHGQLGQGALGPTLSAVPVQVGGIGGASAVAAGGGHSCAIASGGSVSCWGESSFGEVGDGNTSAHNVLSPFALPGFTATVLTAGQRHTCAVSASDAQTYCWGSNVFGTLGNEYQAAVRATPQRVARPR